MRVLVVVLLGLVVVLAIRVNHNGTMLDTLVLTPRAAELHALMPYKAPPDMSRTAKPRSSTSIAG